jgi:nucleoid-associated protein YgaU
MTRCMTLWALTAALGLTMVLGGCNRRQATTQAQPQPLYDAPPPADTYSTGYTSTTPSQPAPAPEPVFLPASAPAPAPAIGGGQTYTIQRGDTLTSISRKFYGTPARVRDIAAANGITDPNKIKVGQTLTLP